MRYISNGHCTPVYGHTLPIHHWIAGAEAPGLPELPLYNPAQAQDVVALLPTASTAAMTAAMTAATQALPAWQATPLTERQALCAALKGLLVQHGQAWAGLISRETGLPRAVAYRQVQALMAELQRCLQTALPADPPGICGLFNSALSPLAGPGTLLLKALLSGQTVVWTPSPATSVTAWILTRCLTLAGLPLGVLNVVYGDGGSALRDPLAQGHMQQLAFAGPAAEAQPLVQLAEQCQVATRLQLIGADTLVVLPDAPLAQAVSATLRALQNPVGATHVWVHRKVAAAFQQQLLAAADRWRIGDPSLDHKVDQGPLPSAAALQALLNLYTRSGLTGIYGKGRISRAHKPKHFVGDPDSGHYAWPLIGLTAEAADGPGPAALIHVVEDPLAALLAAPQPPFAVMLYTEGNVDTEPLRAAAQARWGEIAMPIGVHAGRESGGAEPLEPAGALPPHPILQALFQVLTVP